MANNLKKYLKERINAFMSLFSEKNKRIIASVILSAVILLFLLKYYQTIISLFTPPTPTVSISNIENNQAPIVGINNGTINTSPDEWQPLTEKQISELEYYLKEFRNKPPLRIQCEDVAIGCLALGHSLAIAFKNANWPKYYEGDEDYIQSNASLGGWGFSGIRISPNNEITISLKGAIERTTPLHIDFENDEDKIIFLKIAKKN